MEKVKPEIEYFFGEPMKIFCGKCGRNMFTSTTRASVEMYLEHNDKCPWCGCGIEGGGDGGAEGCRVHPDA